MLNVVLADFRVPKKGEHKDKRGVCGASIDTIVARNFARKVAAGTASHSDHAREVVETFLKQPGETQALLLRMKSNCLRLRLILV